MYISGLTLEGEDMTDDRSVLMELHTDRSVGDPPLLQNSVKNSEARIVYSDGF